MAIVTVFDLAVGKSCEADRKLWKRTRWERLREMVAKDIETRPGPDDARDLDGYAQYVLDLLSAAVEKCVPISDHANMPSDGGPRT
jgi:hypothetical protein